MQLSKSGRIIIIDDNYEDAKPIMNAFGKHNIPYVYYDGNVTNLPENGNGGIRFIFLDIELEGMKGSSDEMKASGLVSILSRIISSNNGPYVIIFWTRHKEVIKLVLDNCEIESISPVGYISIEKADCFIADNVVQTLTAELEEKLASIGAFQLYVEWENLLHNSSKQFISDFTSLTEGTEDWDKKTFAIFYNLYKAYVEKNDLSDKTEQFKCACHLMNRSFFDTLESKTTNELALPDGFELTNITMENDSKAKLNSSLLLGKNHISRHLPGCVYFEENDGICRGLVASAFTAKKPNNFRLVKIILTPECDIANNKIFSVFSNGEDAKEIKSTLHRIVYGLLYPLEEGNEITYNGKGQDARYSIGPFWFENKRYMLNINFSTLSVLPEHTFNETSLFVLKRDLLFDLQSKAANHVNRLGNYQIK